MEGEGDSDTNRRLNDWNGPHGMGKETRTIGNHWGKNGDYANYKTVKMI